MTPLTEEQTALARSRMYQLLGRLFLQGVDLETLPYVRELAPLEEALIEWKSTLAEPYQSESLEQPKTKEGWLDQLASAHQNLFSFQLFPYESIFLGAEQATVGALNQRLFEQFEASGFPVATNAESPDHIGVELMYLSFLSRGEAEALANHQDPLPYQRATKIFLRHHLLIWLPALAFAIQQTEQLFFTAVASLTLSFVDAHWNENEYRFTANEQLELSHFFPPLSNKLDDHKTGLREIAEYLLTPALVGFAITRRDLRKLSRSGSLPSGFGKRSLMLHNIMRSAAEYDGFSELIGGILVIRGRWHQMFEDRRKQVDLWNQKIADMWIARLKHSHDDLLIRIAKVAKEEGEIDG